MQAELMQPYSNSWWERIDVQKGWRVADFGCGIGVLFPSLVDRVGANGCVVGIDSEERHCAECQSLIDQRGWKNVCVLQSSALNTSLPLIDFDLCHERLVAPYVDPQALMTAMLQCLKPGGVLAWQEIDTQSWDFYPEIPIWQYLKNLIDETFALSGDQNYGRKTHQLFVDNGVRDVTVRCFNLAKNNLHPFLRMPLHILGPIAPKAIAAGIATQYEIDLAAREFETALTPHHTVISPTFLQVSGKKP
jgi:ubiquinone/menaquinone biosynthesis C-methylase UbiE